MTKEEAVAKFGKYITEKARDMCETDLGKVLFQEDCMSDCDEVVPDDIQEDTLNTAMILYGDK